MFGLIEHFVAYSAVQNYETTSIFDSFPDKYLKLTNYTSLERKFAQDVMDDVTSEI